MINKIEISPTYDVEELDQITIHDNIYNTAFTDTKAACFIKLNKISYPEVITSFEDDEGVGEFMIDVADSHDQDTYDAVSLTYRKIEKTKDELDFFPTVLYYVDQIYMSENYKPEHFKEAFTKAMKTLNRGIDSENYLIIGFEDLNFSLFSKKILENVKLNGLDDVLNKLNENPELLEKASLKLSSFLDVDYNKIKSRNNILYLTGSEYEFSIENGNKKKKKLKVV